MTRDLVGQVFGGWTVLSRFKGKKDAWLCRCSCGREKDVTGYNLLHGRSHRCMKCSIDAAHGGRRSHGMSGTKPYKAWQAIKNRCNNKGKSPAYRHCGGRGIKMAPEWVYSFETFFRDVGHPPGEEYSLMRIDSDGDFVPGNMEWRCWGPGKGGMNPKDREA